MLETKSARALPRAVTFGVTAQSPGFSAIDVFHESERLSARGEYSKNIQPHETAYVERLKKLDWNTCRIYLEEKYLRKQIKSHESSVLLFLRQNLDDLSTTKNELKEIEKEIGESLDFAERLLTKLRG